MHEKPRQTEVRREEETSEDPKGKTRRKESEKSIEVLRGVIFGGGGRAYSAVDAARAADAPICAASLERRFRSGGLGRLPTKAKTPLSAASLLLQLRREPEGFRAIAQQVDH
jgi:hypothetical protein